VVLLGDFPAPNIFATACQIVTQGRQIRALRPVYLEQKHALIKATCQLLAVLQSIVTA
jgi:hypothetical protein